MGEPISVLVVDGERISREYVELLMKPSKTYRVTAALPLAADALRWCREHGAPDLIIMDVMMPSGPDGITAAQIIKQSWPAVRIILTTSLAEADWPEKARAAGVDSFWYKTSANLSLPELMDQTMAGRSVYPEKAPEVWLGKLSAGELTAQQRRVLRLLTEGLSNREIAERLVISPHTVKDHLDEIMEKADIHSRTALAVQASRLGIVISEAERLRDVPAGGSSPLCGAGAVMGKNHHIKEKEGHML